MPEICAPLMEDKDVMIRFGIKVREIDRAYEKYNNQDFDNGVYHKFAYKNNNGTMSPKSDNATLPGASALLRPSKDHSQKALCNLRMSSLSFGGLATCFA